MLSSTAARARCHFIGAGHLLHLRRSDPGQYNQMLRAGVITLLGEDRIPSYSVVYQQEQLQHYYQQKQQQNQQVADNTNKNNSNSNSNSNTDDQQQEDANKRTVRKDQIVFAMAQGVMNNLYANPANAAVPAQALRELQAHVLFHFQKFTEWGSRPPRFVSTYGNRATFHVHKALEHCSGNCQYDAANPSHNFMKGENVVTLAEFNDQMRELNNNNNIHKLSTEAEDMLRIWIDIEEEASRTELFLCQHQHEMPTNNNDTNNKNNENTKNNNKSNIDDQQQEDANKRTVRKDQIVFAMAQGVMNNLYANPANAAVPAQALRELQAHVLFHFQKFTEWGSRPPRFVSTYGNRATFHVHKALEHCSGNCQYDAANPSHNFMKGENVVTLAEFNDQMRELNDNNTGNSNNVLRVAGAIRERQGK